LYQANIRRIYMMEIPKPLAVRRTVAFCEAIYEESKTVEGVTALFLHSAAKITEVWTEAKIPVLVDPDWKTIGLMPPDVVVDAILAKKNLGTKLAEAPLVIGFGPGFEAGRDTHMVVETNRGHNLGRVLTCGKAESNTGVPGNISGYAAERILRAPTAGVFKANKRLGDKIRCGATVGIVNGLEVQAAIDGVLRGLIHTGTKVSTGLKLGDIDPRGKVEYCDTISDKAIALGGSVLEAILRKFNQ